MDLRSISNFLGLRSNGDEVFRGAALSFVLRACGSCLAFVLHISIGRLLGAEGAGLFFLSLSVISIGSVVAKCGLDNALLRFISLGRSDEDWHRVFGVFRIGMRFAICSSAAAACILFIFAPELAAFVFNEQALSPTLRVMSLGILTFSIMTLLAESLKGLKCLWNSVLVSAIFYPAIALIIIWPLVSVFGVVGAALTYVIATGLAAVFGWTMWRGNLPKVTNPFSYFDPTELWQSCRGLWPAAIVNRGILPWCPLFLLGIWSTTEEAGIFAVASRIVMLLTFLLVAVNTAIAPKFVELHTRGEINTLGRLARRFGLLTALATCPLLFLLIFAGDWVLGLFGQDFREGGTILAILALGQGVNIVTGSVGVLLMMTGHERDVRKGSFFSVLLMAAGAPLLIPTYGMIGAAILNAVIIAFTNIYLMIMVGKRLGFGLWPMPKKVARIW